MNKIKSMRLDPSKYHLYVLRDNEIITEYDLAIAGDIETRIATGESWIVSEKIDLWNMAKEIDDYIVPEDLDIINIDEIKQKVDDLSESFRVYKKWWEFWK